MMTIEQGKLNHKYHKEGRNKKQSVQVPLLKSKQSQINRTKGIKVVKARMI